MFCSHTFVGESLGCEWRTHTYPCMPHACTHPNARANADTHKKIFWLTGRHQPHKTKRVTTLVRAGKTTLPNGESSPGEDRITGSEVRPETLQRLCVLTCCVLFVPFAPMSSSACSQKAYPISIYTTLRTHNKHNSSQNSVLKMAFEYIASGVPT